LTEGLARWLWGQAMRLATPVLLARWWWRGKLEPGYRAAMAERLGFYAGTAQPGCVWLHAVSLGETLAAAPLIEQLRLLRPGLRLLLTHTTATGREAGRKLLREGDAQCWLPLDTPGSTRRFFAHWQPAQGVLMETEVWPTLLFEAERARVPVDLANARLSEKSLRKGERFGRLLRGAAQRLRRVLAQTAPDAERLRRMGAREVAVAGNLKFDSHPEPQLLARGRRWREQAGRPVLLFAVSREGEEALLLEALSGWPGERPLLLVVPRHPQRFDEVEGLLQAARLRVARRSTWGEGEPTPHVDAWLGDSMGEMPAYYAAGDLALLGGSFARLGGQNLIQAAACGCPLLMGPHTFNFADAAEAAVEAGAAERVADMAAALSRAQALLRDATRLKDQGAAGLAFAQAHQGAAERMAARLLS
jgi:3-deoxy-D-manno-octulosonic-acid transferase